MRITAGSRFVWSWVVTVLPLFFPHSTHAADESFAGVTVRGFAEGRLAASRQGTSWEDGGLGKTRFSGTGDLLGRAQAAALIQVKITWDWTAIMTVTVNSQQYHPIDAQEVFLRYKPAPMGSLSLEGKVGIFLPPISLENTGIAWTSPYTLSPSALNAWIGDEVRALGGELNATRRIELADTTLKLRATVGIFGFDDPAGALLAWRGWAVHDRTAGIRERQPLSDLRALRAGGTVPQEAPWVEPFHELDGRPGYYTGLSIEGEDGGLIRALYYDNRADTDVFDGKQYAWHTRFVSLGAKANLPGDVELVMQAMGGRTTMKLRPQPLGAVVDVDFRSSFVLASRAWGPHRLSLRLEYFDTRDRDLTPDDNNAERGNAVTVAYTLRPAPQHRLTLEVVRVRSGRPERAFQGLAPRQTDTIAQGSWRISF